ncbi:MAG: carbohydrate binding family 9 domain-containing protein, partial [Actinobacteria bacterium]|nr:carbohydrate binding family 9 domain-containing protein [Actinomycetota bacterium]
MLVEALLVLTSLQDSASTYNGRANRIHVDPPRIDTVVSIDGRLDEPVWARAARLTGFSQYQPVDGRVAEEPTEVLMWYSADAIYFGIRAREIHGNVVRATRANRDNIESEDQVQILLDTDNERQLAFLFGVNALGVQQDVTRSSQFSGGAGGSSATGGGFRNMNPLEGTVDLNPDYFFESRGRLVEGGYEVEVRIPFKSLRYQDKKVQTWGIHILRRVQHSGFQDTWAPAVRANANFLAQSGTLEGLHDLKRGLVLEATPTVTARMDRAPAIGNGRDYERRSELGADARWGIRQNLTLNGTINPDFSQVEADVGQVLLNERFALFYPEKRPFFLDGLELFDTPNQLIYTRRIVAPRGGVKLAGKLAGANVAAMVVSDDRDYSWTGAHTPLFGIARLRRDFARNYTLGTVLTVREDGEDYSRLAAADLRFYHSRLYFVQLQAAQSWTDS